MIPSSEGFVDHKQLWSQTGVDGKCQAQSHAKAIGTNRCINKLTNSCKLLHGLDVSGDSRGRQAMEGQKSGGIFPTGFEWIQAAIGINHGNARCPELDGASCGENNASDEIDQCALTRTVVADHPNHLARLNGKVDIPQGPELPVAKLQTRRTIQNLSTDISESMGNSTIVTTTESLPDTINDKEWFSHAHIISRSTTWGLATRQKLHPSRSNTAPSKPAVTASMA